MKTGLFSVFSALVLLVSGIFFPWSKTMLIIGLCYGLSALGVAIPAKSGQVSFGHAMFACVAAYSVAFIARAFPAMDGLLLLVLATLFGTLFSALLGLFVVRYRGIFFGMLNLAVSMVIVTLLGKLYNLSGGTDGIRVERPALMGMLTDRSEFETLLLVLTLLVGLSAGWFYQRFTQSATGEALAGLKSNETRLEYLGISAHKVLWVGYVWSGFWVSLAGAIFALAQGLVTPDMGSWTRSGELVFIMILGGASHALGPFVGAAVFQAVKLFASAYMAGVWQMLLGLTLLTVIAVAPDGILGAWQKRRESLRQGASS
ncbi:MAG: branched-chain amino acid ABC transporter permease [Betaproteobacteria bacterium]|nr:branched-chain amino acid ABC transporter permease [Betaproteobacteria bacterium]